MTAIALPLASNPKKLAKIIIFIINFTFGNDEAIELLNSAIAEM